MNIYTATIGGSIQEGAGTKFVLADTDDEAWDKFHSYQSRLKAKKVTIPPDIISFQYVGQLLNEKEK